MIKQLKNIFYFPIASYFRFLAGIRLAIWKPRIIVVTGTSGKTTLLHLIESQLRNKAKYSHFANSSFGIPFDILGLRRKKLTLDEWFYLFIQAPLNVLKKFPKQKMYVVEADCDRPKEGKFLANLLKPEVILWTGVGRSHSANFDKSVTLPNRHSGDERGEDSRISLVKSDERFWTSQNDGKPKFSSVEQAIAYEFGYFLEEASDLAILNSDDELIKKESRRSNCTIKYISQKDLNNYKIFKHHTEFKIKGKDYSIKALLPKDTFYSILMTLILLDYLKIKTDDSFSKFSLAPGRCSLFRGIKNTTIIDSTYNATPSAVMAILNMFDLYPANKKWLVLGDMIELGNEEQEEHEKLAEIINSMKLDKIILVGPRLSKYTYPKMETLRRFATPRRWQGSDLDSFEVDSNGRIKSFLMPKDALDYLLTHLRGSEVLLFKGARFLEGIIEHLLLDKKDVSKLCRRELVWQERRKKWGL